MNFVAEQNIARFREMLASEKDPAKRKTIEELLRKQQSKIAVTDENGGKKRTAEPLRAAEPTPGNRPG